jgi:hypothetical protein
MRRTTLFVATAAAVAACASTAQAATGIAAATGTARLVPTELATRFGVQFPEFRGEPRAAEEGSAALARARARHRITVNRALTPRHTSRRLRHGTRAYARSLRGLTRIAATRRIQGTSFHGLDFFQQRFANNGNQFSVEPPDQGLCAGKGMLLETVNDVLRVYDAAGNPLSDPVDLNTFYGYAPAIDRTTNLQGPFVTDPSCFYDPGTQRWVHVVLTLDVDPVSGDFLGPNHLDIAVSNSSDPLGAWTIYTLPVQDDGTDGTPNHGCTDGEGHPGPCIGDYPHIGYDANGVYITTNEYELIGPEFIAAQLYAFSKKQLTSGAASVPFQHLENLAVNRKEPGFTVWPAIPNGASDRARNGTEHFLSSDAAEESGNETGSSKHIIHWRLTNTRSLDSAHPDLRIHRALVKVREYSVPPDMVQRTGDVPLSDCLNIDCLGLGTGDPQEPEGLIGANDTRMQQVVYHDGTVWGTLDTAVASRGRMLNGIDYYGVSTRSKLRRQARLKVGGNSLTRPSINMLDAGGVVNVTLVGKSFFPSQAYVSLNAKGAHGALHIAARGAGPQDGFTEYPSIGGDRPRWGDYSASTVLGGAFYIANEYIGQTCTFEEWTADSTCGGTRAALGNWGTRITKIVP